MFGEFANCELELQCASCLSAFCYTGKSHMSRTAWEGAGVEYIQGAGVD